MLFMDFIGPHHLVAVGISGTSNHSDGLFCFYYLLYPYSLLFDDPFGFYLIFVDFYALDQE